MKRKNVALKFDRLVLGEFKQSAKRPPGWSHMTTQKSPTAYHARRHEQGLQKVQKL